MRRNLKFSTPKQVFSHRLNCS